MSFVSEVIREELLFDDSVFVFPSEIAASFWRRESLSLSERRAVRSDRFISWDTFKERAFALTHAAKPANRLVRMLFAADLLRRNADDDTFLRTIVLPDFAASWKPFVTTIARMLPSLGRLMAEEDLPAWMNPALRSDLDTILLRYRGILDENDLYEPGYQLVVPGPMKSRFTLFYTELVHDFADFAPFLQGDRTRVISTPEAPGSVARFANTKVEIQWVCLECLSLLQSGVESSDIAITLADREGYYEELRDTAALYDIPLLPRIGKPLADYTEVRLYRTLSECVETGYGTGALKKLFLNAGYPWKNPGAGRGLVRFGIDNYGLQNYRVGGGIRNMWNERLSDRGSPELRGFFNDFRRAAENILGAKTFDRLRRGIQVFNGQFLETGRFTDAQARPFSAALEELPRLEEAASQVPGLGIDSPFSLWMTSLRDRIYVQPLRGDGIPVYEYRVASGIHPPYHFVLGCGQQAVSVVQPRFGFLPVTDLPERFQQEGDFTEVFLQAYCHSGDRLRFSCGYEGAGGPILPAEYFLSRGAVEESGLQRWDPYRSEAALWSEGGAPAHIHRIQKSGLTVQAATGFREKGVDLTKTPLPPGELSDLLMQSEKAENGEIRISPTDLDAFSSCRFSYFLARVLGLEEMEFDTVFSDARETGNLLHKVFSELIRHLAKSREGNFGDAVPELVEDLLSRWARPAGMPPVWNDQRRRILEFAERFLEVELATWPDAALVAVEDALELPAVVPSVTLHGRIDRISTLAGGCIVIDYKKRLWQKKSGMVSSDGRLLTFQVPCYVLLVEGRHGPVTDALYYDMTEGKYHRVFGAPRWRTDKPWFDNERKKELLVVTLDALREMARAIEESSYATPTPRGSCAGCDFRPVCREKFLIQ